MYGWKDVARVHRLLWTDNTPSFIGRSSITKTWCRKPGRWCTKRGTLIIAGTVGARGSELSCTAVLGVPLEAILAIVRSYEDGCAGVASPSGKGANGFQAVWLWWFTVDADSFHGTTTRRDMARDEANRIFDTMFDQPPCFNITRWGTKIVQGQPLNGTCIASQRQ